MTTAPSQESVTRQVQLADEALGDAKYLLQDNRLTAAINRAYYAMFYAASAAMTEASVDLPKTHKAVVSLFHRHLVKPGRVDRRFHHDFAEIFKLRQRTDYEIYARIGPDEARLAVEKAEAFVAEIKRGLKNAPS